MFFHIVDCHFEQSKKLEVESPGIESGSKTPVKPGVWFLKAKIATILPQAYTMKNHLVEPPGIEPGSKQGNKELSTRLVSAWILVNRQGRKLPPVT